MTDPTTTPATEPQSVAQRIAAIVTGAPANDDGRGGEGQDAAAAQPWPDDPPPRSPVDAAPREGSEPDEPDFEPTHFEPMGEGDWLPGGVDSSDPVLIACAAEPLNDIGNGRRLRARHGADMLFIPNLGWHRWDGRRWYLAENDEDAVREFAHATAEAIALEVVVMRPTPKEQEAMDASAAAEERLVEIPHDIIALDDEDISSSERKRKARTLKDEAERLKAVVARGDLALKMLTTRQAGRRRFATTSGNSGKLDGMIREARPKLTRGLRELDPDPLAVNVLNGTIRFHKVEEPDLECPDPEASRVKVVWRFSILPHDRSDLITKLAPVFHCPEARAPIFLAFLERIVPDLEVRAFLQRFFGYCLTALTTEQMFCIFHGQGSNGKSTLVDIIARVLGDYATSVPVMSLVNESTRKGSEATPDLIRLPGARFVRSAEPKEGLPLDESLIKELTSGEPINVRRLNHEFIEVYPDFKLAISCNTKPKIYGNDDGIWRRVNLVPFEVQIPKEERDKALTTKMQAEMAGILNWMIEGALDFLARGALEAPEKVLAATQEYRDESDVVGAFVRAALEVTRNPNDTVEAGSLYSAFTTYCEKVNITPLGKNTFNRRMPKAADSYGFEKAKASVSLYCGIRIRSEFDPSHTRYF